MLRLANEKVSLKNRDFLSLSSTKKKAIIISKMPRLKLLILWALTLVHYT